MCTDESFTARTKACIAKVSSGSCQVLMSVSLVESLLHIQFLNSCPLPVRRLEAYLTLTHVVSRCSAQNEHIFYIRWRDTKQWFLSRVSACIHANFTWKKLNRHALCRLWNVSVYLLLLQHLLTILGLKQTQAVCLFVEFVRMCQHAVRTETCSRTSDRKWRKRGGLHTEQNFPPMGSDQTSPQERKLHMRYHHHLNWFSQTWTQCNGDFCPP